MSEEPKYISLKVLYTEQLEVDYSRIRKFLNKENRYNLNVLKYDAENLDTSVAEDTIKRSLEDIQNLERECYLFLLIADKIDPEWTEELLKFLKNKRNKKYRNRVYVLWNTEERPISPIAKDPDRFIKTLEFTKQLSKLNILIRKYQGLNLEEKVEDLFASIATTSVPKRISYKLYPSQKIKEVAKTGSNKDRRWLKILITILSLIVGTVAAFYTIFPPQPVVRKIFFTPEYHQGYVVFEAQKSDKVQFEDNYSWRIEYELTTGIKAYDTLKGPRIEIRRSMYEGFSSDSIKIQLSGIEDGVRVESPIEIHFVPETTFEDNFNFYVQNRAFNGVDAIDSIRAGSKIRLRVPKEYNEPKWIIGGQTFEKHSLDSVFEFNNDRLYITLSAKTSSGQNVKGAITLVDPGIKSIEGSSSSEMLEELSKDDGQTPGYVIEDILTSLDQAYVIDLFERFLNASSPTEYFLAERQILDIVESKDILVEDYGSLSFFLIKVKMENKYNDVSEIKYARSRNNGPIIRIDKVELK